MCSIRKIITTEMISDALIRGNLLDIKEKLTSFLAKQKLDTRVEIERVGNSQYLFVSTRNDAYLTDEDTEYLIPVRGRDVYQVGNHFSRYTHILYRGRAMSTYNFTILLNAGSPNANCPFSV